MAQALLLAATDPNSIYLLRRYAEECGFSMVNTSRSQEVLALARQVEPAAIILEIGPPGVMDWGVLKRLRAEESTRCVPVMVYSWSGEELDEHAEGVTGYLRHPLLYSDFVAALEEAGVYPSGLS